MEQDPVNIETVHANGVCDSRRAVERLLERTTYLEPSDRALLRSVFGAGVSANELAAASGRGPQSIRRRLRRVLKRMNSDAFTFVLRNADYWPAPRRAVARAVFLRGLSQRGAAKSLGLPLHAVRVELYRIRMLCEAQGLGIRD